MFEMYDESHVGISALIAEGRCFGYWNVECQIVCGDVDGRAGCEKDGAVIGLERKSNASSAIAAEIPLAKVIPDGQGSWEPCSEVDFALVAADARDRWCDQKSQNCENVGAHGWSAAVGHCGCLSRQLVTLSQLRTMNPFAVAVNRHFLEQTVYRHPTVAMPDEKTFKEWGQEIHAIGSNLVREAVGYKGQITSEASPTVYIYNTVLIPSKRDPVELNRMKNGVTGEAVLSLSAFVPVEVAISNRVVVDVPLPPRSAQPSWPEQSVLFLWVTSKDVSLGRL